MSLLVFGSANADIVFRLPRLPRAGETVLGEAGHAIPGGKGLNQAVAAARAGARVSFVGSVGDDAHGAMLRATLQAAGVATDWLVVGGTPTGLAAVMVDGAGANQIAVSGGANALADAAAVPDAALAGIVLMQMEVPPAANAALMARTRAVGGRSILNLAPAAALPALPDILVVNEPEAAWLAAQRGCGDSAEELQAALGCTVIRTLGAAGSEAADHHAAGFAVAVSDTVGAGDAWCGALAAALLEGTPLHAAMRFANAAGALSCTRTGAYSAGLADIRRLLAAPWPAAPAG